MAKAVKGVSKTIKKVQDGIVAQKSGIMAGLLAGGLIVEAEAKRRVPREYGNLVGSGYTRKSPTKANTVEVGFSAAYALWVHENREAKWKGKKRKSGIGVYWGPSGEPRYLANALTAKRKEAVRVAASYRRKK